MTSTKPPATTSRGTATRPMKTFGTGFSATLRRASSTPGVSVQSPGLFHALSWKSLMRTMRRAASLRSARVRTWLACRNARARLVPRHVG